ncbi:hypothetical protein GP475_01890 [Corynebacterium poyangense]|uniref:Uncharacterized protein n=1 Tax=Corynebacterium poyangense TaxID=2684405 RepID=A0A7H0SLU6_9CORY|nr:hypothetical protein [Corynebacterium poyangense]MBZ8177628.1 hypothetical protein [Corynebacterium poyangense]QNQ89521.1 hypothetical protein GP475_01890 [Corynebacterium poyangense]
MHWTRLQKAALGFNLFLGLIILLLGLTRLISVDTTVTGILIVVLLSIVGLVRGKFWGL